MAYPFQRSTASFQYTKLTPRFVSLLLPPSSRQSTHHLRKTLDPVYPAKDSTFDFPLYMSMASVIAGRGLEAVVWDKDMLGKDYMGELSLPMKEWFPGGTVVFMHEDAPVRLLPILL